jgi:hypothetical protein
MAIGSPFVIFAKAPVSAAIALVALRNNVDMLNVYG